MNWEAIGAVGEIVGAFAVVLSLVYLATQVRTQNRESRLASMHQTVAAQREAMQVLLEPQISEDFLVALGNFEEASPGQRLRFSMAVMIIFKATQDAYLQHIEDRLDEELFQSYGTQLADLLANESARIVWRSRRHQFDGRYRDYVDNLTPGQQLYT